MADPLFIEHGIVTSRTSNNGGRISEDSLKTPRSASVDSGILWFNRLSSPFSTMTTSTHAEFAACRAKCPLGAFFGSRHPCTSEAVLGDTLDQRRSLSKEKISEVQTLGLPRLEGNFPEERHEFFPPFADVAPNLLAGIIAGLKMVLGMVLFADIVFNAIDDPNVRKYFPAAININMLSACIHLSVATLWSDMNVLASPQDIPSLVLSELVLPLSEALEDMGVDDPYALGNMVMSSIWISALIGGIFAFLLGRCGVGSVFQKIPTPVVGGFISAMGAEAVFSALSTLIGTKFSVAWPEDLAVFDKLRTWSHLGLGLATFVVIRYLPSWIKSFAKGKCISSLACPICLLAPLAMFYIVLTTRGRFEADMIWMREKGWLYQEVGAEGALKTIWSAWGCHFDHLYWRAYLYPKVMMMMFVLQILSTLSAVLGLIGAHSTGLVPSRNRLNIDKELRVMGCQNLLAGLAGGNYGYVQMGMSANLVLDGGTHRLAHLTTIIFVLLVYVSGFPISSYVPKFFLSGIFLNLGVSFMYSNLAEQCGRMGKPSYASMWAIVIFSRVASLNAAVVLGFMIQVAIMLCIAASQDPVFSTASTSEVASQKLRSSPEQDLLRKSQYLKVARLRGPVFFGSSSQLKCHFDKLLANDAGPRPLFFIIDLQEVTFFDDSAVYLFAGFAKDAAKFGAYLFFAGAGAWEWMLQQQGWDRFDRTDAKQTSTFETLDDALQCCEDSILQGFQARCPTARNTYSFRFSEDSTPRNTPRTMESDSVTSTRQHVKAICSGLDEESLAEVCGMTVFQWNALCGYCDTKQLPVDATIYERATVCDSMFILVEGVAETWRGDVRGRRTVALDLLGAACFCAGMDHVESAYVVSVDGARVLELTRLNLNTMKSERKEVYDAFIEKLLLRVLGRNLVLT